MFALRRAASVSVRAVRPSCVSFRGFASGLKYLDSHEYLRVEGGEATVGITNHAQGELGDVVYVELPEVGASFDKGEVFGSVESVKAASSIYLPVGGEVIAVNDNLSDDSSLINSSPEADGWIVKIKMSNPSEADELMDETAYVKHCEESAH